MAPTATSSSTSSLSTAPSTALSTTLSTSLSRTTARSANTSTSNSYLGYGPFIQPSKTSGQSPTQSTFYTGNSSIGSSSGGISWEAGLVVVGFLLFGLICAGIVQRRRRALGIAVAGRGSQQRGAAFRAANQARNVDMASRIWANAATSGHRSPVGPLPETELEPLPAYVEPPPYKEVRDEDAGDSDRQNSTSQSDTQPTER